MLAVSESDLTEFPHDPAADSLVGRRRGAKLRGVRLERISEPVHRPQESLASRALAKRTPHFGHEAGQGGIGDKRRRPQSFVQFFLRQRPGAVLEKQTEKLEGLR